MSAVEQPGHILYAHGEGAEEAFRSGSLSPRAVISAFDEGARFVPLPI